MSSRIHWVARLCAARLGEIAGLVMVLAAMDQLYRWLHPVVNPVRATLVGATAWAVLRGLALAGWRPVSPEGGALAVFASAFASVMAIQAGWLVSRSGASVAVHVALVAVAWLAVGQLGGSEARRRRAAA